MITELAVFENHNIRAIEQDNDIWVPLVDLARAWGLKANTLYQLISRNEKKFVGFSTGVHVTCSDTLQGVNEKGMYLLMGAINTDRLKNPDAAASLLRFQRWVPELIQKYRKKEIVQVPAIPSIAPSINTELQLARVLAEQTGGNLQAFQKIALGKCGHADYAPALDSAPALVHGEPGWYNPTRLVSLCNDPDLTAERLNYFLMNKGFQYRDGYIWRLTPEGMVHGREYNYEAPSGHREIRISWRESILYASGLKRPVNESQLALPVRA
jgi:hypothetical protein